MKKNVLRMSLMIIVALVYATSAFAAGDGSWERVKKAGK